MNNNTINNNLEMYHWYFKSKYIGLIIYDTPINTTNYLLRNGKELDKNIRYMYVIKSYFINLNVCTMYYELM